MLDHISFSVNNYAQSLKFYDETLEILGMVRLMNFFETEERQGAGYGLVTEDPFFGWVLVKVAKNWKLLGMPEVSTLLSELPL